MTILREAVADAAVDIVSARESLSAIHNAGCAAAIWHRQLERDLSTWLESLEPHYLPKARTILQPDGVREALDQACDVAGTPACSERDALIEDTAELANAFARLMTAPYLRLRYDVVTTNACRKFHIDAVTARLVCTFRGTGTQYGFSAGGHDPTGVYTVPTGSPIVLRGTRWPENPRSGLRHRSPPIEGTGETRLVLVLDPILDIHEEV